jgi:dTDP-4-dehydrorhamnose 3,5-epimerase
VKIKKTVLDGPLLAQSSVHGDSRGAFLEWFKKSELEFSLGEKVSFSQGNVSKSAKGVLRGIHYSTSEEGQAKWVTCLSGKIIDYVIDLRISSPTFTKYIEIPLSGFDGQGVYIPQGFGHAFVSLEDDSIVGNSDKMLFYAKEFAASGEDEQATHNPYVLTKLNLKTISNYSFEAFQKLLQENSSLADALNSQDDNLGKRRKIAQHHAYRFFPKLKARAQKIFIPSMLFLTCNSLEVLRLRQLLLQSIEQRLILEKVYEK